MSTGTGIYHSEYNASKTEDAKFLQIWIIPNVEGTKPEYHNYDIRPLLKRNELATFISSPGNTPAPSATGRMVLYGHIGCRTKCDIPYAQTTHRCLYLHYRRRNKCSRQIIFHVVTVSVSGTLKVSQLKLT